MNIRRGDVLVVDWPFSAGHGGKVRPALAVQNDRDNQRLTNTIVAMITGTTRRALEPTQLVVDIATSDGQRTGLRMNSVINCVNLFTIEQSKVIKVIGQCSTTLMNEIDRCLQAALGLP